MTKTDLQQELLAKVKPGTKPSHLKKSKSESNLASNKVIPTPLLSPTLKIKQLEDKVTELQNKCNELATENKALQKNPPNQLLLTNYKPSKKRWKS